MWEDLIRWIFRVLRRFSYGGTWDISTARSRWEEKVIRYCGSMLKYSVSEWEQEKSVTEVILEAPGQEPVDSAASAASVTGDMRDQGEDWKRFWKRTKTVSARIMSVLF